MNHHDNCSNSIRYHYPIYISNNTAIVEGVITTVFMLILYYTIYVAGWSAIHNLDVPFSVSGYRIVVFSTYEVQTV